MVLKLENVADWFRWEPGKMLPLPSDKHRTVRLEVNCEQPTLFKVMTESEATDNDEGFFLGVVEGYEVIEFKITGNCLVSAEGDGAVWFYTSEKDVWWAELADQVSFTKPYEHRPRDPVMEAMQRTMALNMQRMEARLRAQFERRPVSGVYNAAAGSGAGGAAEPPEGGANAEGQDAGSGSDPAPADEGA